MDQILIIEKGAIRTSYDRRLSMMLHQLNVKGDWLYGVPDLDRAQSFSQTTVNEIHSNNPGFLKHKPFRVVRKADSVIITHQSDKGDYTVFTFQKINNKTSMSTTTDSKMVPLVDIKADPGQPRKYFDEASIDELSANVKQHGILQAILVRPVGKKFMIVFGERRWRAAKKAGLTEIPATIKNLSNEEALEIQLIENLHRENPHPMEEAVAFLGYMKMKGLSIDELAAKMARKVHYIKQRLKLNDLTKDWQKLFFDNGLMITDALKIAQLRPEDQEDFYFEEVANVKGSMEPGFKFELNEWDLNKYKGDLKKATFDITDKNLDKSMGACTTCKFNTAYANLFPDEAEMPRCTNSTCFRNKTKVSFDTKFKEAKNDSTVVFISSTHGSSDKAAIVNELNKIEKKVLNQGRDFDFIPEPEKPDWECFKDDNEHMEYSEEEMQAAFQKEQSTYDQELKAYEKKLATGKFQKAFVVDGNNAGSFRYVELKKSELDTTIAQDPNGAIHLEILRIQETEEEAREQDAIIIHKKIKQHLQEFQPFLDNGNMLSLEELTALAIMNLDYSPCCNILRKEFKFVGTDKLELFKKIQKADKPKALATLNRFMRGLIVSRMAFKDAKDSPLTSGAASIVQLIAEQNFPSIVNGIRLEQQKVYKKRNDGVMEKITALEAQLDTARPKVKKGIKSLIN